MERIKSAVFDLITNSEDKMVEQFKIQKSQSCVYLRAYIIMRLLFFKEIVISDSSINLNRALRTLILQEEGRQHYDYRNLPPADFAKLIENGSIKLAARDIYRGNFSRSLRDAQSNKKRVDLPSEKYTRLIDERCREREIYWWNEKEVSRMFTKKIRMNLGQQYSDEINSFLRHLSNRLSGQEILTYNIVKNEALKMCKETSEEYRILYGMLRDSYDYNIPEYLDLNYLKVSNGFRQSAGKHSFELDAPEHCDLLWKYSFNIYALALLPADRLTEIWASGEYARYERAIEEYVNGKSTSNFNQFFAALEKYLDYLDRLLMHLYINKYGDNNSKNIILRFKEYKSPADFMALIIKAGILTHGVIGALSDMHSDPAGSALNILVTNILPSIVLKRFERSKEFPAIEHAIIRLE